MIIVISPAKTLDFETPPITEKYTLPSFLDDSAELIDQLRALAPDQIGKLMSISPKLATLNSNRYYDWALPFNAENAKQAVLAFKGDVYTGLDAESLNASELTFAQNHLRMLSGLYGVLRPLDLMQAYRLEMGTPFKNHRGNNLYEFWGNSITESINQDLAEQKTNTLINLASNEYFKSVKTKQLNAEVITPVFKDQKKGVYKIISFFAKKARGLMSRYIIQNKLTNPQDIKGFDLAGYRFDENTSIDNEWVFIRDELKGAVK
ncbi:MAG: peroxide stress protein YaaA [Nitrosomonas sp.]|nr:peroxide stress protein YaaA [Nitrosomonas sp.]